MSTTKTATCEHCHETVTYDDQGNYRSLDGDPICYDSDNGPVWHAPCRSRRTDRPSPMRSTGETIMSETQTHPMFHAWADGFGVWHVRVSRNVVSPLILARRVLRDELEPRVSNLAREVYMRPVRVPEKDDADTLVYREGEA